MSPSVAVLRISAHPDIGILCHSSEERFRDGCFPLGSAIARLLDYRRPSLVTHTNV